VEEIEGMERIVDNKFFDFKMKVITFIWVLNCLIIIFVKYSVVPETYCYDGNKIVYCTELKDEKQNRNVDGISKHNSSHDSH
jgi:hypothetical protein